MNEELCEKVVEVKRVSDKVMAVVLVFEEDLLRLFYLYVPQLMEIWKKNSLFCNEVKGEWDMYSIYDVLR